jgi:GntR family transcriptional regulator
VTIDRWSATPSYAQLAELLRRRIAAGEWGSGDVLPSEKSLMQEYDLARETVRHAIRVLRDEGLVVTIPARGSFVSPDRPA